MDDDIEPPEHVLYEVAEDDAHLDVLEDVTHMLRIARSAAIRYEWSDQDEPTGLVEDLRKVEATLLSCLVTVTAAVAMEERESDG